MACIQSMKVLVVDDVGYSRHTISRLVESIGHTTVTAANGAEALAMLTADASIQVVLTDLMLGDFDGVDLFLKMRQLERLNDEGEAMMPSFVLVTSAAAGRAGTTQAVVKRLQLATEIGFRCVLTKPVDADELRKCLSEIELGESTSEAELSRLLNEIREASRLIIEAGDSGTSQNLLKFYESQITLIKQESAS